MADHNINFFLREMVLLSKVVFTAVNYFATLIVRERKFGLSPRMM